MRKAKEIRETINDNNNAIRTLKNEAETLKNRLDAITDGMTLKECIEERKMPLYEEIDNQWIEKLRAIDHLETVNKYLWHNFKIASYHEILPQFCAVLKKYAGKRHGVKTAEKVRDEILALTGWRVYFHDRYATLPMDINAYLEDTNNVSIQFSTRYGETDVLVDNVIQPLKPEAFKIYHDTYFEDIEQTITEQRERKEKIDAMRKELARLERAFANNNVDGIKEP